MGSSGTLVKNIELKICDDDGRELPVGEKGEIVIKGENVMKAYRNNQEATNATIKNSWLHTGDMGYMTDEGFLYVLGRFKSLLIADDGEKYSPEGIEESLVEQSLFIDQCMLYNNQNAYTSAVIYPNTSAIKSYISSHSLENNEKTAQIIVKLIKKQIDEFLPGGKNSGMFPQRWIPSCFALIDEGFTEENHLMNSTLKIVRPKIIEKYKSRLESLYTSQGKNITNADNLKAIMQIIRAD